VRALLAAAVASALVAPTISAYGIGGAPLGKSRQFYRAHFATPVVLEQLEGGLMRLTFPKLRLQVYFKRDGVGAIGILTMMWIAVGERTAEIGLARAIGASRAQVVRLFLVEAALLSLAGGTVGVLAGIGAGWLLRLAVPALPLRTAPEFIAAALAVSLAVGLSAGVLPARRAAALDPVEALRAD